MNRRTPIVVILVILALWLPSGAAATPRQQAGAPTLVTYQGYLTDASGHPIAGTVNLRFGIYTTQSGGSALWEETHNGVSLSEGYFSVLLGSTAPLSASVLAATERWLQVTTVSGSTYTDLPRQRIAAAPFALQAQEAASAPWGGLTDVPVGFADGVDNGTTYSAGAGLSLAGTTFNVVTSTVQQRVGGTCAAGSSVRAVNADGTVACETDDVDDSVSWSEISGIVGTGSNQVAAGNHGHDAAYVNDNVGEVGDADVAVGGLSPNRISGTAWTSANDGSGSGLDADALDGHDTSYFATSGHNHDTAYVNDNGSEVGDADVPVGGLSPNRISGTAWTSANDGSGSGLDADTVDGHDTALGCRVIAVTQQLVPASGLIPLSFDTEIADTSPGSSCWSITNPTYLYAPSSGYYMAGGTVTFETGIDSTGRVAIVIRLGDGTFIQGNGSSTVAGQAVHVSVSGGMFYR